MKDDAKNKPTTAHPLPTKRTRKPPPERHAWFDPWLVAKREPLRNLVGMTVKMIDHYEEHYKVRDRERRPDDAAKHRTMIDVVISNLAHTVLAPPPTGRIAVRLGGQRRGLSRYNNRSLGPKPFRRLIYHLDEHDFLSLKLSTQRGEVSSVAPSEWFTRKIGELGVSFADFGRDPDEELIVLTRNTRSTTDTGERVTKRKPIDYKDTEQTCRYRDELRRLNSFIALADITFVDDGLEPPVNIYDRAMRRHFVILKDQPERFDQCGRLFGGFWLPLKSARRSGIRINGEPVADLDFATMFTRLAYARLGACPPAGDLYAIEGAEGYRSGIKLAMNTFLFDTNMRRSKWPKEMGIGVGTDAEARNPASAAAKFDHRLPAGWTVGRTRKAILKTHPKLRGTWGRGLGHELMFDESRILLASLTRLMIEGIVALGMHDGLLVQHSKKDIAKAIMEQAAREIAGMEIKVEEKG